jgi:hypothetical protein
MAGIDEYVKLMLHFDGTGQAFVDSSLTPKTIIATGNATQSTSQYKWAKSAYLDGNGVDVRVNDIAEVHLSGDFTIDFWAYLDVSVGGEEYCTLLGKNHYTAGKNGNFLIRAFKPNTVNSRIDFSSYDGQSSWEHIYGVSTFAIQTWYHIALVRSGTDVKMYKNGTLIGSTTSSRNFGNNDTPLVIGRDLGPAGGNSSEHNRDWNGYIDEFRLSNGTARWTSDFIPLTEPYSEDQPQPGPTPILCWSFTAKHFNGRLFSLNGPGFFPSQLNVPSSVDKSTGVMVDGGQLIDPSQYTII